MISVRNIVLLCLLFPVNVNAFSVACCNPSQELENTNLVLINECVANTRSILGFELEKAERPYTFIDPSCTDVNRISAFIELLNKREGTSKRWQNEIDKIFYLKLRYFVVSRVVADQKTQNDMLRVVDRWYNSHVLNRRLMTNLMLSIFYIRGCNWNREDKVNAITMTLEKLKKDLFVDLERVIANKNGNVFIIPTQQEVDLFVDRLKEISIGAGLKFPWTTAGKVVLAAGVGALIYFWVYPKLKEVFSSAGHNAAENISNTAKDAVEKFNESIKHVAEAPIDKLILKVDAALNVANNALTTANNMTKEVQEIKKVANDVITEFKETKEKVGAIPGKVNDINVPGVLFNTFVKNPAYGTGSYFKSFFVSDKQDKKEEKK